MKFYKFSKTMVKSVIGFCIASIAYAIYSTSFYLKADEPLEPSNITNIGPLIDRGLEFLEYFTGSIAFISLVIAGMQFITAGGNSDKVSKAKKSLLYCIGGIILFVLSYALARSLHGMLLNDPPG